MSERLFGCIVIAAIAGGCASAQRKAPLIDSLRDYNESMRWSKFDKAALSVPVLEREDFLDERDELAEDLYIDDVEIKRMRYRRARTWARVDVQYTWHLDSRGIVQKTVARQIWELDGDNWLITGETRVRGEPMPGLDEPETEEVTRNSGDAPGITQ